MKILVYSSASTFGGHELISLKAIEALLAAGHSLELVCSRVNEAFVREASAVGGRFPGRFTLHLRRYQMRSLQILRTWLGVGAMVRLWRMIREISPDRILALQGDIEQGSEIMLAARFAGVPVVSYIPMVMPGRDRGIRFATLRDALARPIYRLARRFIVIAPFFGEQAVERGAADVVVVPNCVDDVFLDQPVRRRRARAELGVRADERLSGYIGRIAYDQKGLDRLLDVVESNRAHFSANRLLLVGDGPDSQRLDRDLAERGLQKCVLRREWNDDRVGFFDAMDVFLCASRFEGVPLTILEALSREVPVVAPPLPALVNALPLDFCQVPFHCDDFFRRLAAKPVRQPHDGQAATPAVDGLTRARFSQSFVRAVVS